MLEPYLGLRVGDPRNSKPKLQNSGTELLPHHLVHLHSSTGGSEKCCDLLPSNIGSARAISFGETPPWQDTAPSMIPPAAMSPLLIPWPNRLSFGLQEERLRFWRQALISWNWEPPAVHRAIIQPKPRKSTDGSYKTKLRGCTKYISVSQWHFKE